MNKRAIVIYLDFDPAQFKMFKMLLTSLEVINAVDTDVIVFFNPLYKYDITFANAVIGKGCEVKFYELNDLKYTKEFWEYGYVNSIACLLNQDWLKCYDFILRTDTDTLLTKKWNTFYPEKFTVGLGAYNYDENTAERLSVVAKKHHVFREQGHLKNLGSTWYGRTEDIISVAALTTSLVSHFLNVEFKDDAGAWPGYYKGVSTLYASEIAINHLIPEINVDTVNFDFPSTSREPVSNHVHIHCWHTDNFFSKMKFLKGDYDGMDIKQLNKSIIADYCLYCAVKGNRS